MSHAWLIKENKGTKKIKVLKEKRECDKNMVCLVALEKDNVERSMVFFCGFLQSIGRKKARNLEIL